MTTPEAQAAARDRMAQPEAQTADRGRKQAQRRDPEQPRTYLRARNTTNIFTGHLTVLELKDDPTDNIGQLGDEICPGCGALHWPR